MVLRLPSGESGSLIKSESRSHVIAANPISSSQPSGGPGTLYGLYGVVVHSTEYIIHSRVHRSMVLGPSHHADEWRPRLFHHLRALDPIW